MGDVQGWVVLSSTNGSGGDYNGPLSPLAQPAPNPHPLAIAAESWRQAEMGTREIIERIQPTLMSEQRRRAVVEYVQNLLRGVLGIQVLPFGSVPLKTYLPDGDIDLTVLAIPNSEDTLAVDLRSALEVEEQNKDAEFEVKDVQYIHAEVRLVKCLVQNIVVDISFNQIGGLSTLCFLEQVDCLIGKSNLFKRSIILIKAWCYYESRILGAHHALISTYALETLVLYIFHLFHSSLDGPLAVLYRFLDYYSKFDWDNYCVSLYGPVSISSLPELVAEVPENDGGDLLLSKDFIRNCVEIFSDPPRGIENNSRSFSQKHLNIVDPLKENNNLGRSVSKGNFYRIRSAFTYGARKLGHILLLPADSIANEVNKFFTNTMDRHGSGERPDVQGILYSCLGSTIANHSVIDPVPSELKVEKSREDKLIVRKRATNSHGVLCNGINNLKISGLDMEQGTGMQLHKHPSDKQLDATLLNTCSPSETNVPVEGNVISSRRLVGDAGDLASIRASGSKEIDETFKDTLPSSDVISSQTRKVYHAPHLFFHSDNGITPRDSTPSEESGIFIHTDSYENELSPNNTSWYNNHGISAPGVSVDGSLSSSWSNNRAEYLQIERIGSNGSPMPNQLADLSGDYDMHYNSLAYAQQFRSYMLGVQYQPIHQSSHSQYQNKYWDPVRRRNIYMNANGVVPRSPFSPGSYPMFPPIIPGSYSMEDMPKPRGTGTYFPNTRAYRDKHSAGRGRNPTSGNHLQRSRSNGWSETTQDTNLREKGDQDPPSQALLKASGNGRGKPAQLDVHKPPFTSSKSFSRANSFLFPPASKVEFGSLGPVSVGASNPEVSRRSDTVSSHSQGSGPSVPLSPVQRSVTSLNTERPRQSYQLKNDDDFPPLAG